MSGESAQGEAAGGQDANSATVPSESPVEPVDSEGAITEIFHEEETKQVMREVVGLFVLTAVGLGILGYVAASRALEGAGGFALIDEEVTLAVLALAGLALAPTLGAIFSLRANGLLSGVRNDYTIATAAVGSGIGALLLLLVVVLITSVPVDGYGIADFLVGYIAAALVAGAVGALSVWFVRR